MFLKNTHTHTEQSALPFSALFLSQNNKAKVEWILRNSNKISSIKRLLAVDSIHYLKSACGCQSRTKKICRIPHFWKISISVHKQTDTLSKIIVFFPWQTDAGYLGFYGTMGSIVGGLTVARYVINLMDCVYCGWSNCCKVCKKFNGLRLLWVV